MRAADLAKTLGGVIRLIETRNVNPILDCVLLEPTDDTLSATAHNLDACATVECPLASTDVLAPAAIAVSGARLHGLVKSLPAASSVELRVSDGRLTVASGRSRYKLDLLPADAFPPRLKADGGVSFELDSATAARLFEFRNRSQRVTRGTTWKAFFCMRTARNWLRSPRTGIAPAGSGRPCAPAKASGRETAGAWAASSR
jgi:DNA polymerase III sliding clamp (beta) subunit (PCNA family)